MNLETYSCDPVKVASAAAAVTEAVGVDGGVAFGDRRDMGPARQPVEHGSHTGSTLAEAVADVGVTGTLLNHSGNRLKLADIDGSLAAVDRVGLVTVVCANNPEQGAAAAAVDESVDVYFGRSDLKNDCRVPAESRQTRPSKELQ